MTTEMARIIASLLVASEAAGVHVDLPDDRLTVVIDVETDLALELLSHVQRHAGLVVWLLRDNRLLAEVAIERARA